MHSYIDLLTNICTTTISGRVLISLFSSFVFIHLLMFIYKPRFVVSDVICKTKFGNDYYYVFKIVNKSFYSLYDVKFLLNKKTPEIVNGGSKINHRIEPITISTSKLEHFPKRSINKEHGNNAFLIRTKTDLYTLVEDSNIKISLTVSARHGFSNLTKIITKEYLTTESIKLDSQFKFGTTIDTYK